MRLLMLLLLLSVSGCLGVDHRWRHHAHRAHRAHGEHAAVRSPPWAQAAPKVERRALYRQPAVRTPGAGGRSLRTPQAPRGGLLRTWPTRR
jgi:hypothetical protein